MNQTVGPEDKLRTVTYCPAKRRPGLPLDLFDRYWKDAHGPLCARVGHIWEYTQFHVAHDVGGIWRVPKGIEQYTPQDEQIDGIAELIYLSDDHLAAFFDAAGVLIRDEQNVFGETTMYLVREGRSCTYVDRVLDRVPNGDAGIARYHVLMKKRPGVELDDLREHLSETFAPNVASHPLVVKFRLHLLDPYSQPWEAEDVENSLAPERQAHAAFEIAFNTRMELAQFLQSEQYEAATRDQARFVRQVSVFPEREVYPIVRDARPTLLGLRGASVAKTITEAGAANNFDEDVTELFMGSQEL